MMYMFASVFVSCLACVWIIISSKLNRLKLIKNKLNEMSETFDIMWTYVVKYEQMYNCLFWLL